MTDLRARCQYPGLLLALLLPLLARADVIDSVNACVPAAVTASPGGWRRCARARACVTSHTTSPQGVSLRSAQQRAGYHALSSFSVSISGVPADGDVTHILATQFCQQSINPAFREIGVWTEGSQVWIAYGEPFTPPAAADRSAISARVLEQVNAARAHARRCGAASYPAVPALTHNALLERAALEYAQEMATFGFMSHTGRDGSAPQERITRSGYRWSEAGENLASGITGADEVVAGWLQSPEHCANIMDRGLQPAGRGLRGESARPCRHLLGAGVRPPLRQVEPRCRIRRLTPRRMHPGHAGGRAAGFQRLLSGSDLCSRVITIPAIRYRTANQAMLCVSRMFRDR